MNENSELLNKLGLQFLHQKNSSLHVSTPVQHEVQRLRKRGESVSQEPVERLDKWLSLLEQIHIDHSRDPRVKERIKRYYHKKYVIKAEDFPQQYWNQQASIMISEGRGGDLERAGMNREEVVDNDGNTTINYHFDKRTEDATIEVVQNDQKRSLDDWIDYLTSEDADYPLWAKYWAFSSILTMGKYEKIEVENGQPDRARFQTRTKNTVSPFPLLNARALAKTISAMIMRLGQRSKIDAERKKPKDQRNPEIWRLSFENLSKQLSDEDFQTLLTKENFSRLYTQFLLETPEYSTRGLREIRGKWVKYPQGSDESPLVDSLQGYPLEWCTANSSTARSQLSQGDFYVYYSLNEDGQAVIPRLAIRMEGRNTIAEPPRGIAPKQNLDPFISPVLEEKMKEFGQEGEKYRRKAFDMQKLTEIWIKNNNGEELSTDDLRFIYEFDKKIEGFGYSQDPRIGEIKSKRDLKKDLSAITGFKENEISVSKNEASFPGIKFHFGNLVLDAARVNDIYKYPQAREDDSTAKQARAGQLAKIPLSEVEELRDLDNADFDHFEDYDFPDEYKANLVHSEIYTLPEIVLGNLSLINLRSAEGLVFPKSVSGTLDLSSLISADGLVLPEHIGGDLLLDDLALADNLKLPKRIGGNLVLKSLTTARGLTLSEEVGGILNLNGLASVEDLVLPKNLGGLLLNDLESANGLKFPDIIDGDLNLGHLEDCEGLSLPSQIAGTLSLHNLKSVVNSFIMPEFVGGDLELSGLIMAEDLVLPEVIGGSLFLSSLFSVRGITFPKMINHDFVLSRVEDIENVTLPEKVGRHFMMKNLLSVKSARLPKYVGGSLLLPELTIAENTKFPEEVNGNVDLRSLVSGVDLVLPKKIDGSLDLKELVSATNMIMPDYVGKHVDLRNLKSILSTLIMPKTINTSLYLDSLTSAENLVLPETIGEDLMISSMTSLNGVRLPRIIAENLLISKVESIEGVDLPESVGGYIEVGKLPQAEIDFLKARFNVKVAEK